MHLKLILRSNWAIVVPAVRCVVSLSMHLAAGLHFTRYRCTGMRRTRADGRGLYVVQPMILSLTPANDNVYQKERRRNSGNGRSAS
ncbi:hypothetical protein C2E23DRAFT_808255 [Lenzites betulinus]|nr:hypothetical protein C2E23DRAFT_808255 [Lenzites betulinus]